MGDRRAAIDTKMIEGSDPLVAQAAAQHALAHRPALAALGLDQPVAVEVRRLAEHAHDLTGVAGGVLAEATPGHVALVVACDVVLVRHWFGWYPALRGPCTDAIRGFNT